MVTLNWETIAQDPEAETVANFMTDAGLNAVAIGDALEVYTQYRDLDAPEVREAMFVDSWPVDLRADWDGEQEVKDTEMRGRIWMDAEQ